MMKKYTLITGAAIAVLLLASCGSTGGLGGILGGGGTNNGTYATQLRGTVDSVDTSSRSIYLINVTGNGSMLSSGSSGSGSSGQTARVYFDNRTTVNYNGQSFRPEDLERGDQVDVTVDQSSNQLYANSMNVVYNARAGNTTYPNGNNPNTGTYGTTVHGTVRAVDTYRGTITVDRGYNSGTTSIPFSTSTPVYYNGQTYRPSDLQVGDEIDVRMNGNSAQDITVTRSMSGGTTNNPGTSSQYATIRGTVRSVNTSNHTIQLDSPSWINNFNRGTGTMSNTINVSYDPNLSINVNGQSYPISGLERGDVIDVQVQNNGNSTGYWAQSISLVRDVRQ